MAATSPEELLKNGMEAVRTTLKEFESALLTEKKTVDGLAKKLTRYSDKNWIELIYEKTKWGEERLIARINDFSSATDDFKEAVETNRATIAEYLKIKDPKELADSLRSLEQFLHTYVKASDISYAAESGIAYGELVAASYALLKEAEDVAAEIAGIEESEDFIDKKLFQDYKKAASSIIEEINKAREDYPPPDYSEIQKKLTLGREKIIRAYKAMKVRPSKVSADLKNLRAELNAEFGRVNALLADGKPIEPVRKKEKKT